MRAKVKINLPAMACAIVPLVSYFLIRPCAEIGVEDDWSFTRSAQVLAQTGHIVYNGWATPMLGWQLYWGALFIKVFGFSFTVVRFSTVIEAMASAFLMQRTFVRSGLNEWNATLATLAFVLSPIYFPYMFTFMTDVSCMLSIVGCLYMCLRAIQAESERSAMVWISLAALVNALGGTVRQIAWLGVAAMVPCALWLLRKNRRVFVVGCISWTAGIGFVLAALYWFANQPYSVPQPPMINGNHMGSLKLLEHQTLWTIASLALFALPVLLMFVGSLRRLNRRRAVLFAIGFLCLLFAWFVLDRAGRLPWWQAPFFDGSFSLSAYGRLNAIAAQSTGLAAASNGLGVLMTVSIMLGILSLAACLFQGTSKRLNSQPPAQSISWTKLGLILGCYSAGYIALLTLSSYQYSIFMDRYLIPLPPILLLVLARTYQERVQAKLPWACVLLIIVFGAFSAAATHDEFALHDGYVAAIHEIQSSGAPDTEIAAPFPFAAWTQIVVAGHLNDQRIQVPANAYVPPPVRSYPTNCVLAYYELLGLIPAIQPVYVVSATAEDCGGQDPFPPVMYRTWIAPHVNWLYAVRLPASVSP